MSRVQKLFKFSIFLSAAFVLNGCIQAALTGATGVGYSVAQERTMGEAIDDVSILTEIKSEYVQKDVNHLFHDINIEVHEGRVLLTGIVEKPEHRKDAVRLAWQPDNVREVINEIQVSSKGENPKEYARDSWITAQIKARLLVYKDIKSINYSVETVNGTVYLMGVAQSKKELDDVAYVASKVKGVNKVISHARIKDSRRR